MCLAADSRSLVATRRLRAETSAANRRRISHIAERGSYLGPIAGVICRDGPIGLSEHAAALHIDDVVAASPEAAGGIGARTRL